MCGWYFGIKVPHNEAVAAYEDAVDLYNGKVEPYNTAVLAYNNVVGEISKVNEQLNNYISDAQNLVNAGAEPYDSGTIDELSSAIANARQAQVSIPEEEDQIFVIEVTEDDKSLSKSKLEAKTADVNDRLTMLDGKIAILKNNTVSMDIPDYSSYIEDLQAKEKTYEDSVKVKEQITCPEESFVIARLQEIEDIQEIGAVTEDHDPNGNLNKPGGYTSTVYFSLKQVDQNNVFGTDIIDKGTAAGGAVETYSSVSDAEQRNTYLATLDGTIFTSGAHMVLGTMVLRASDELTASQQNYILNEMVIKLTELKQ